jgi:hypothetical protein
VRAALLALNLTVNSDAIFAKIASARGSDPCAIHPACMQQFQGVPLARTVIAASPRSSAIAGKASTKPLGGRVWVQSI